MKYAKFSDDFLSYFRLDDNGETLVLTDKRGYTRAVKLLTYEERPQGDLISREALKKQVKELLDLAVKRVNDTPTNSPCYRMYIEQENERARLLDLIDNAPTVEPTFGLFREMLCSECEKNCMECKEKRSHGEWIMNKTSVRGRNYTCTACEKVSRNKFHFCPNCGADMRKGEI